MLGPVDACYYENKAILVIKLSTTITRIWVWAIHNRGFFLIDGLFFLIVLPLLLLT